MSETTRMNLIVDGDVPAMLAEMAGGKRKMGEYLTQIVRQLHAGQLRKGRGNELDALQLQLAGLAGELFEAKGRLSQVEAQTAAIMARG